MKYRSFVMRRNGIMSLLVIGMLSFRGVCLAQNDSLRMDSIIHALPEVMVKGIRPIAKVERGKLIYNMPLLLQSMGADNALEALTRIPGVADQNGDIMFGGRNVTLIINGKPTTLTADQVKERLRNMPAAQLAKTEVMLSAPAKYHTRGTVINVVTKNFTGSHQVNGQLTGVYQVSKYGTGIGKGNLIMQEGKFGLDAQYGYRYGSSYGESGHNANHPLETGRVRYYDMTRNKSKGINHDYRLGMDYAFSDNHRLSLAYTGTWNSTKSHNTTEGLSTSDQESLSHDYLHNVDLSYDLPIGLSITASYTHFSTPQSQQLDGTLLDSPRDLMTRSDQKIEKWMFTADETNSLGKGWELNYGVKAQFSHNNSWQSTVDGQGEVMADATSSVNINERIWDFYAGFSKQFSEAFSLEASLEAEQYHSPVWDKWHVYPTVNALWNVNEDNILNLSFSSNASYPSYWSTMSSVFYSSTYSEIWGNPNLKPSSEYDVNLMWQFRQRYTLIAFGSFQPNYFGQLPYQPTERMAVIMKEDNWDYRNNLGLQASAQFNAGSWLYGNVSVTGIYTHDKSDHFFDLPFDRKKISFIFSGTGSVKLLANQNLRLILNPFVQTKAIQGVYDINPIFMMDASLRWESRSQHWAVTAKGNNIFNGKIKTVSRQGNQDFSMTVAQNWATFAISITYKFGNYKPKKVKSVDTSRMGH